MVRQEDGWVPTRRKVLERLGAGVAVGPLATGTEFTSLATSGIFRDDFQYTDSPTNHGWNTDTSKDSPCNDIETDGEFLEIDAGDSNHCNLYQGFALDSAISPRADMRARSLRDYTNGEGKVRLMIHADDKSIDTSTERVTLIFADGSHDDVLRVQTGGNTYTTKANRVDTNDWQQMSVWFDGSKTVAGKPTSRFFEISHSPSTSTDFRVYLSNGSDVTEHDWIEVSQVTETNELSLEIEPGAGSNPITTDSGEYVRVGILQTIEFDPADQVDVSTLRFGEPATVKNGGGATPAQGGDVGDFERDGDDDLVVRFPAGNTGFDGDETTARLECKTADGTSLYGEIDVQIVG